METYEIILAIIVLSAVISAIFNSIMAGNYNKRLNELKKETDLTRNMVGNKVDKAVIRESIVEVINDILIQDDEKTVETGGDFIHYGKIKTELGRIKQSITGHIIDYISGEAEDILEDMVLSNKFTDRFVESINRKQLKK
jgi:hypothetical protein